MKCPKCGHKIYRTPEEILEDMKKFHEELLKNPESCRKFLISTGIYNEDGTLKEEYK